MRFVTLLLLLVTVQVQFVFAAESFDFTAKVTKITDGDTYRIATSKGELKIRAYGIDAPEKNQEFSKQSTKFLSNFILNKQVKVQIYGTDRYGRVIADIMVNDTLLSEYMVKNGYAWWYEKYAPNRHDLEDAQKYAKRNSLGVWKNANATAPWNFRKKNRR